MPEKVIYILTNPSFPNYIKIGYADNLEERVRQLNQSECIPFAFRVYAYYETPVRLNDIKLHKLIDYLNPNLRSVEWYDGKRRVREYYSMKPEDAYFILESIATISGTTERLHLVTPSEKEKEDEEIAIENTYLLNSKRQKFPEIVFSSSLTGHKYKSSTNKDGSLCIYDLDDERVIQNYESPSKNQIVHRALMDLTNEESETGLTLYEAFRKIVKKVTAEQGKEE